MGILGQNRIFSVLLVSILLSSTSLMAISQAPNAYAGGGGFESGGFPICSTNPLAFEGDLESIEAMTYWAAQGVFLVSIDGELFELTPSGVLSSIDFLNDELRGLAFNLAGDTLYGIGTDIAELYEIDPDNNANIDNTVSINFINYNKGHGLATDPTTGTLYGIIADFNNNRILVTINPLTGDTTTKGQLPDSFGSLAFTPNGMLYGTTGFNDGVVKSFFKINKDTAGVEDFVCHYGGGSSSGTVGGQALAYNPDDAQFYQYLAGSILRFDGQTVNLPCDTTNIPPINGFFSTPRAFTYWAVEDKFLDSNGVSLRSVETDGTITFIANVGSFLQGLAFNLAEDTLYGTERFSNDLLVLDHTDDFLIDSTMTVTVTLPSSSFDGIHDIATDPNTGTLYALLIQVDFLSSNPTLVTIDPSTGFATKIALLTDNFGSISFNSAGELFGVTSDGAGNGEVYWSIDKTTGAINPICGLGNGSSAEGIAYNSVDGAFYHRSGIIFEKINGVGSFPGLESGLFLFSVDRFIPVIFRIDPFTAQTLDLSFINSEFPIDGASGLADNPGNTLYVVLVLDEDREGDFLDNGNGGGPERRLAIINPSTGDTTDIGELSEEITGLAFKDGTLFGVTGRDQFTQEPTLVTISTFDATVTTLCQLDGSRNSIALNPTDGFLYYSSNFDGIRQILDTETCELGDPIGSGGFGPLEFSFDFVTYLIQSILPQAEAGRGGEECDTKALTWSPLQNLFLCGGSFLTSLDPTLDEFTEQVTMPIGQLGHDSKGLAFSFVSGPAIGGTSIPIDTTSLIVAGSQMTMAWLIPVLVAGAGIVFVLVRRK